MTRKLWFATMGALLAVPLSALAQHAHPTPDPSDPGAAVAPARYESAFLSTSLPPPQASVATPDKVWKAANDIVAAVPAHAEHAAPAPTAKPAVPPVVDHSKHH